MNRGVFDFFTRVYVVNLPARTDRLQEVRREFERIGSSLGRPNVEVFPAVRPTDLGGFRTIGARGCFLSHLEILRRARDEKFESVLIIEDDLTFAPALLSVLPTLLQDLSQRPWHIAYLGHMEASALGATAHWETVRDRPLRTTHFVAFHRTAIGPCVSYLEALLSRSAGHPAGGPMDVDGAYSWFRRSNASIVTLLAQPNLGFQRHSASDVSKQKLLDRFPLTKWLIQLGRRIANTRL